MVYNILTMISKINPIVPGLFNIDQAKKKELLTNASPSKAAADMVPRSPEADKNLIIAMLGNDRKPKIFYSDPEYWFTA